MKLKVAKSHQTTQPRQAAAEPLVEDNWSYPSTCPSEVTNTLAAIMLAETLEHPVDVRRSGSMDMSIQNRVGSKGFVCMSARFVSVLTFLTSSSLARTRS